MQAWIDALVNPVMGGQADAGKVAFLYIVVGAVGYKYLTRA